MLYVINVITCYQLETVRNWDTRTVLVPATFGSIIYSVRELRTTSSTAMAQSLLHTTVVTMKTCLSRARAAVIEIYLHPSNDFMSCCAKSCCNVH